MPSANPRTIPLQKRQDLHSIGEAASLVGVSIPTLRLYEREGLVLPRRKPSRHRLYSRDDIERVKCLRHVISEKKISIQGIKHLLAMTPCWQIKECPREVRERCPAFRNVERPCWLVEGRPTPCGNAWCGDCPVYRDNADCTTVKSRIIALFETQGSQS